MTNLQFQTRSRKKPMDGDVFAMLLPDEKYLFGRVITTSATVQSMTGVLLLYVYSVRRVDKQLPERKALRPAQLLISPVLTNRRGWSEGLFETIANVPLDSDDVLETHCFERFNGDYFDEHSNKLPGAVEPVGRFGLGSFRTMDDSLSRALGFDLAPD